MNNISKTIVVTGAAGYLASWVVKQLIEKGHKVHGTVRSLEDISKVAHLLELAEAMPDQLKLFEADLMQDGSFDAAMERRYLFFAGRNVK